MASKPRSRRTRFTVGGIDEKFKISPSDKSCSLEIATDDRKMDICQRLNSFQFNDNFGFDDKIKSMLANLMIAIEQGDRLLPHKCNSANGELNGECLFVNGFKKSWPKLAMYRNCRRDNGVGDF